MFPQLISGPICMYSEIQPQMHNRRVDIRLLEEGMETFVLGLSAKTLLANPMGGLWNNLSVIGYDSISTLMPGWVHSPTAFRSTSTFPAIP